MIKKDNIIEMKKYADLVSSFLNNDIDIAQFEKVFLQTRREDPYVMNGLAERRFGRLLSAFFLDIDEYAPEELRDETNIDETELRIHAAKFLKEFEESMKTKNELESMLATELFESMGNIRDTSGLSDHNQKTGMSSAMLAMLLNSWLREIDQRWAGTFWMDDSIFSKMTTEEDLLKIWGTMIFGEGGRNVQWTMPFYFEAATDEKNGQFKWYNLLAGDRNKDALLYEKFDARRGYWDEFFYKNARWDITERQWEFSFRFTS